MSLEDVVKGNLNLETVDSQFCSDWLKNEIRCVLIENRRMKQALIDIKNECVQLVDSHMSPDGEMIVAYVDDALDDGSAG